MHPHYVHYETYLFQHAQYLYWMWAIIIYEWIKISKDTWATEAMSLGEGSWAFRFPTAWISQLQRPKGKGTRPDTLCWLLSTTMRGTGLSWFGAASASSLMKVKITSTTNQSISTTKLRNVEFIVYIYLWNSIIIQRLHTQQTSTWDGVERDTIQYK